MGFVRHTLAKKTGTDVTPVPVQSMYYDVHLHRINSCGKSNINNALELISQ
jgi:hypothetical protein